ncbi:hypothetical protein RhiirA1_440571 [Rhizophagus irregularis]|uniref:Uncharacterized protein n=1 Tax=Rhizophagus irregularis TaxID=588596 RepID=A0A2I1EFM4_9GLOM|nr:hypothetical protein RhiirA1_440571 [Rhizophagus irregularis]PKY20911.1 hypothetical protein RhiirB3_470048 [Rhizophagus irregularis]
MGNIKSHLKHTKYIYFKVIFSPVEDKLIQGCKVLDIGVTKPGGCIEVAGRRNDYVGDGSIFRKLTDAIWSTYLIQNIDVKLAYNLDSKFELQPNVGEVHRIEKDFILGPMVVKLV